MYENNTIEQNVQHQLNVHANNIAHTVQDSASMLAHKDSVITGLSSELKYMDKLADSLSTEVGRQELYNLNHNSDMYFGIGFGTFGSAALILGVMAYSKFFGTKNNVRSPKPDKRPTGTIPDDGSRK